MRLQVESYPLLVLNKWVLYGIVNPHITHLFIFHPQLALAFSLCLLPNPSSQYPMIKGNDHPKVEIKTIPEGKGKEKDRPVTSPITHRLRIETTAVDWQDISVD